MKFTLLTPLLSCLFFSIQLIGHGPLDQQIKDITNRIEKDSANANLFLRRGQLYAQHEEFIPAREDYLYARNLNQDLVTTDFLMAKLYAQNEGLDTALIYANIFLHQKPNHAKALIARAGIYQQLGQSDACKKDLETAILNIKEPTPGDFAAIAEAVLLTDATNLVEALGWLEKGQKRYGFDIVLQSKKIDLYQQGQQYEQAIMSIDEIIERFARKEKWLFRKAQIYQEMKKKEAAISFYEATLSAIQQLPKRLQATTRILQLELQTLENIAILSK